MQSISDTSSRNASESVAPTSLQSERRVRSSEAFCRFTFEQSQCSKTQSMNAARSSAMPLMRQPVKRQFRNVSPGKSPSVSVRFSNRTNSTSVSSSAACENSAARSAQGSIAVVACCVSYQHPEYSTYGNARTTNKKTTPEECMLKNPTQVNHCVHLSRQYVIMVSK